MGPALGHDEAGAFWLTTTTAGKSLPRLEARISHLQRCPQRVRNGRVATASQPQLPPPIEALLLWSYGPPGATQLCQEDEKTSPLTRDALEKLSIYFHAEPICNLHH